MFSKFIHVAASVPSIVVSKGHGEGSLRGADVLRNGLATGSIHYSC